MFVICYLVAGHRCAAHAITGLLLFSTASQMVTATTPPLPPVFVCISLQYPTVAVKALFRVGNFDFESKKVHEFDNHYSVFNEVLSGI